jgi:hypothetical protein
MSKKEMTLTSVKVQSDLFEEFKVATVRYKFSLQKLTERSMYLYNTDPEFRRMIQNIQLPKFESSNQ